MVLSVCLSDGRDHDEEFTLCQNVSVMSVLCKLGFVCVWGRSRDRRHTFGANMVFIACDVT